MRPQSLVLPVLAVLVAVLVALFTIIVLGEDSDAPGVDSTPEATASAVPTDENGFGPAPQLGGNVIAIVPDHGATVTQAQATGNPAQGTSGICARVDFEGLPEGNKIMWVQMAVDGEIVTNQLAVSLSEDPAQQTEGTFCYQSDTPIEPGRHSAAVSITDPDNPTGESKQIVGWEFDVSG
jgi:hypothetical protein